MVIFFGFTSGIMLLVDVELQLYNASQNNLKIGLKTGNLVMVSLVI